MNARSLPGRSGTHGAMSGPNRRSCRCGMPPDSGPWPLRTDSGRKAPAAAFGAARGCGSMSVRRRTEPIRTGGGFGRTGNVERISKNEKVWCRFRDLCGRFRSAADRPDACGPRGFVAPVRCARVAAMLRDARLRGRVGGDGADGGRMRPGLRIPSLRRADHGRLRHQRRQCRPHRDDHGP